MDQPFCPSADVSDDTIIVAGQEAQSRNDTQPTAVRPLISAQYDLNAPKRARYVSRACERCKNRKLRCSTHPPGPCQRCMESNTTCVYPSGPRKRRNLKGEDGRDGNKSGNQNEPPDEPQSSDRSSPITRVNKSVPIRRAPASVSIVATDIESRLKRLEELLPYQQTTSSSAPTVNHGQSCGVPHTELVGDDTFELLQSTNPDRVVNDSRVDRDPGHNPREDLRHPPASTTAIPGNELLSFCCRQRLQPWFGDSSEIELSIVTSMMRRYFLNVNPFYFCLNQAQFFSQFDDSITGLPGAPLKAERAEFLALVKAMLAQICILEDGISSSDELPGWDYYLDSCHFRQHALELGQGTLIMIQCYLLQAGYLMTAGKDSVAYSVISRAVELCYLHRLHDQHCWDNCSPFEIHLRQRVFWSLYCFDKTVSQLRALPSLIRFEDTNVELPALLDDEIICETEVLPSETPSSSISTYLHAIVNLSHLGSEIWHAFFGAKVSKQVVDDERIAIMDARILHQRNMIPSHLQVETMMRASGSGELFPSYMLWQALMYRMLTNNLRLSLRTTSTQPYTVLPQHQEACVSISSDTITIIYNLYHSVPHQPFHKALFVTYLASTLMFITAAQAFKTAVELMKQISPDLTLGQRKLKRLDQVFRSTEKVVQRDNLIESFVLDPTLTDPISTDMELWNDGAVYNPTGMFYIPTFDACYWDVPVSLS